MTKRIPLGIRPSNDFESNMMTYLVVSQRWSLSSSLQDPVLHLPAKEFWGWGGGAGEHAAVSSGLLSTWV